MILLCLELMLNAGTLALVAFPRAAGNEDGQVFALIVMVVAARGGHRAASSWRCSGAGSRSTSTGSGAPGMSATTYAWLVLGFPLAGSM